MGNSRFHCDFHPELLLSEDAFEVEGAQFNGSHLISDIASDGKAISGHEQKNRETERGGALAFQISCPGLSCLLDVPLSGKQE